MFKKILVAVSMCTALLAAGCGSSTSAPDCPPIASGVDVCVGGKALSSSGPLPFHMHEAGGYYAPVNDLAAALNVKPEVAADKKSVTVNSKTVQSSAQGAKNVHDHTGTLYAPVKEFAEAAGYKVVVNTEKNTVSIYK